MLTARAYGVSFNATKIESMSPDPELKHSTCDSTDIKAFSALLKDKVVRYNGILAAINPSHALVKGAEEVHCNFRLGDVHGGTEKNEKFSK